MSIHPSIAAQLQNQWAQQAQTISGGTITASAIGNAYVTGTTSAGSLVWASSSTVGTGTIFQGTANSLYASQHLDDVYNAPLVRDSLRLMGKCTVADGESATITLPDGSVIEIARDGSFKINDKDSKVIYRANRIRDFNPYINVSDQMEKFIDFCGQQGVRREEMLELPVSLFIGWLVIQAAKQDKEPEPDVKLLPDLRKRQAPQCLECGKFISRDQGNLLSSGDFVRRECLLPVGRLYLRQRDPENRLRACGAS